MKTLELDRKTFIGGSDIASVMGLSRWKTPLQLWAEKTGEVEPDDLSEIEAVQLGLELEEFVAKKFQSETGLLVRRSPKHYIHARYDFLRCQVDRLITSSDELLEVKTCSAYKLKEWEGEEIPQEYILQVMWELGITGRSIGWIAVLIGGQAFRYKKIVFDKELFETMVDKAVAFWKMVEDKTPPMAEGLDNSFIVKLNPVHDDLIKEAEQGVNESISLLQETKAQIINLEEQRDELEARLKQIIGENLGIKTNQYLVTWKSQPKISVDTQKLKDAGIYDQYKKEISTRVLRIKKEEANHG